METNCRSGFPRERTGPGNIFFEAWNSGDGNLNLQVNGGFSPWLQPQLSGSQACSFDLGRSCQIIDVFFDSAGLPNGTFQGSVTVSDPSAMDSPQRVPVTIHIGGTIPERIDLYTAASPRSTDEFSFQTPTGPSPTVRVSPAGPVLDGFFFRTRVVPVCSPAPDPGDGDARHGRG